MYEEKVKRDDATGNLHPEDVAGAIASRKESIASWGKVLVESLQQGKYQSAEDTFCVMQQLSGEIANLTAHGWY